PGRPCDVVRRASIKLTSSPLRQNRAERASTNRAARAVELDEPVGVSNHQRGTESSNPSSPSGESGASSVQAPSSHFRRTRSRSDRSYGSGVEWSVSQLLRTAALAAAPSAMLAVP